MIEMKETILLNENYKTDILLSESEIRTRVQELGAAISRDYAGKNIVLIGALTGSFIFMADLCREIELDLETIFLQISSYHGGTETSGEVTLKSDIKTDITGKDVIIVEDIVDSGISLKYLMDHIKAKQPKSIKIVALLSKPESHKIPSTIDYLGFEIENKFVIGYGLDFAEHKRNLKNIYTVQLKNN